VTTENTSDFSPVDYDPFADGELADATPVTAAQGEIWVASQLADDASLAYNESITITCRGPFDLAAMKGAIAELPARHEALRSTFSRDGKSLCIGAVAAAPIEFVDLSLDPAETREARLIDVIRKEATTPFDLERGPLLRATIVRVAEDDHRVVLGSHHIVCDGWSFAVLLKDLGPLYSAKRAGLSPELAPAHGFSTYAREEAARDATREQQYWMGRFESVPDPLDLPTDRARPALRLVASDRVDLQVSPDLVAALRKAGARRGASFFVTLFAAWNVFIARVSGQRDLVIGVPTAGQSAVGREMLVGHCANLLPIRTTLDLTLPFAEVLKETRRSVLDAYDHQRFTLGEILPQLKLPRDPSRLPLVALFFNLDTGMEGSGLVFEGLDVTFRANPRVAETSELFLNAFESKTGVVLECQYATTLWDSETIAAWLGGYEALLRAIAENPEAPCSRLPIVNEADRRRILVDWNATRRPYPEDKTIVDLFAEQAARAPDKAALIDAATQLSYGQLEKQVRGLSAALRHRGVGQGDLVALCVERSVWMIAALLAIMDAGAGYIPIDPEYPRERIALMLKPAKLVIVDSATADAVEGAGLAVASLPDLVREAEAFVADGPWVRGASPSDRAYVLFTSGSTGVPKGVEVSHKNLVNFVTSMQAEPGVSERDVLVAVVTLSFDMSNYELYVPLAAGATIVVADRDTAADGRELADLIRARGVTTLQATPTTYRLLKVAGFVPTGLKVVAGGEVFPPEVAAWLLEGGAEVWNGYGPTETTVFSAVHHVRDARGPIPIGRPAANTTLYVLDAGREPLPIGVFGELYIGGDGVARGYLGQPALTEEKFVPDPFSDRPGALLYRTGDSARFRHDGRVEFLGRSDDQVKIRGHRVEIGEIDAALHRHPAVQEGAVGVIRVEGEGARLVAFLVPRPKESITPTDLRRHLRKSLPDAMVPQQIVELTALPRTPNGKIDRRALAKIWGGEQRRDQEIVAPSTPSEILLADIVKRALKIDSVSVNDTFFDLGGDSFTSMAIVIEIERATGMRVAPRKLLLSSLADLARTIAERRGG
jgi:amino acid adenylation domain-containing protein